MGYCDYLKNLLRPLGIYDLSDRSLSASELEALGHGLDGAEAAIDYAERESALSTAEGEGLDRREAALATRLCFGTLQTQMLLDWHLGRLSKLPLDRLAAAVRP